MVYTEGIWLHFALLPAHQSQNLHTINQLDYKLQISIEWYESRAINLRIILVLIY